MRRIHGATCFIALAGVAFSFMANPSEGTTCCTRELAMVPTAMPAGQIDNLSGFVEGAVIGPLMDQTLGFVTGIEAAECPEIEFYDIEAMIERNKLVDAIAAAAARQKHWPVPEPATEPPEWEMDYILRATLTADSVTGTSERVCEEGYEPGTQDCWGGHLSGTFTFTLRLVDHHHDDAVLKEKSVSWSGSILEGLGFWRPGGADASPIRQVVNAFMPLQEIIKEHERIPETAKITLPVDVVGAGDTVTITVSDLFEDKGQPTQPWQRVLVKVEKGTILNGDKGEYVEEGYSVFRAGKKGEISVRYASPPECERTTETLSVHNTCNKKEKGERAGSQERTTPKNELAMKEFDISCDRWLVDVTYTEEMTYSGAPWEGSRSFSQTLKAELNRTKRGDPESWGRRIYEATSANLDLEDRFQQVTQSEEGCKVVAGWHGEHHGPVAVQVRLQFDDRQSHCFLDSKEVTGDLPVWRSTFQWSGCDPYPDAACEMTDATSTGVFNIGTGWLTDSGEPLVFAKGQEVLRGERRWTENGTDAPFEPEGNTYMSANCTAEGYQQPFTTSIYYGLATESLSEATKTITWEIRRPGTSP
jgi:hypothetical protein